MMAADLECGVVALQPPAGALEVARLLGRSGVMQGLHAAIRRVARSSRPALVTGPTGCGKELVARALHGLGPCPEEPFLDINCGAIPESLMESQLFGHERGAFTGAERRQEGYLAAVGEGTLFLDEIAELPLPLQAKLLRVLETGRFRAVGSTQEQRFAGRVVAATHADLEARVAEGRFREDLLYRLNVLELRVPALAERREDIPLLVGHFLALQPRPLALTPDALELLVRMDWPGNVRQLRNLVDRIAVLAEEDTVSAELIRSLTPSSRREAAAQGGASVRDLARALLRLPFDNKLRAIEEALFHEAMRLSEGNKSRAARLLGVHRKVVERRLERREDEGVPGLLALVCR